MRIICINLGHRVDRWNNVKNIPNIERFDAINSVSNPYILKTRGFDIQPTNYTYSLYFYLAKGAVGCYLSHYAIWEKMVLENIPHYLIIEDDLIVDSLLEFLQKEELEKCKNYDIVNLSKRVNLNNKINISFNGAEAYVVSLNGAKKLIEASKNSRLLSDVKFTEELSVQKVLDKLGINSKCPIVKQDHSEIHTSHHIIAPVDKLISMCCNDNCHSTVKLNYIVFPVVDLSKTSIQSDVGSVDIGKLSNDDIKRFLYEMVDGTKNQKIVI